MVQVEGIAEAYMGGVVRVTIDQVSLLFTIDGDADAEKVQIMKRILIEMKSGKVSDSIIKELMKRVQGLPPDSDPDVKKQRDMALRALEYAFKNVQITIKNVHIRMEIYNSELSSAAANPPVPGELPTHHLCCALGATIPSIRVNHQAATRPEGVGKTDPVMSLSIKNLQVYCDYGCESYVENLDHPNAAQVLHEFTGRWKEEVHTAMLLPFDIEIVLGLEIRSKTGLLLPRLSVNIPKMRLAVDPKQLLVLKDIIQGLAVASKRSAALARLPRVFTMRRLPPALRYYIASCLALLFTPLTHILLQRNRRTHSSSGSNRKSVSRVALITR